MKSAQFYAKRELTRKKAQFLPFLLICAVLAFTCVSILILGASLDRGSLEQTLALFEEGIYDYKHNADALNENSLLTPMYLGVCAVLLFMFGMASAVLFAIRNEEDAAELGVLRTLGMKRRDLLRIRQIEAMFCFAAGAAAGTVLGVLVMKVYSVYVLARAEGTVFIPLKFAFPAGYVLVWMLLYAGAVLLGVGLAHRKPSDVREMIRSGFALRKPGEDLSGSLDSSVEIAASGTLYERRAKRMILKNNLASALGLILPMFFILGGATLMTDYSTNDFSLENGLRTEGIVTEELAAQVERLPGVKAVEKSGLRYEKDGWWQLSVWADGPEVHEALIEPLKGLAEAYDLEFTDSVVLRKQSDAITGMYRLFLYLVGGMLFCAALALTFASVRANLRVRRREIAILRALGSKREQVHRILAPETAANFAVGSGLSVLMGVGGFLLVTSNAGVQLEAVLGVFVSLLMLGAAIGGGVLYTRREAEAMMNEEIADTAKGGAL
ncbi:MAG: FtsX-like permease family protein [Clostridia bacterium]|nr:FtsX-like permease family protein [Clostridia bacterium]